MFKTEPSEASGKDSLMKELNDLRSVNYWLTRNLEREALARHRAELDLRLLQMEMEDKRGEQMIEKDSQQVVEKNSVLHPLSPHFSFVHVNKSQTSFKVLVDKSAANPYSQSGSTKNLHDLKYNHVIKDILQKEKKCKPNYMKQEVPANIRSKQNKRTRDSGINNVSSNRKKKHAKKQIARSKRTKSDKNTCFSGKENFSSNDQRKRLYVFCKHCRLVRNLLPVNNREGMPSAFRHKCNTPAGKINVQRTLIYRSSTCRAAHLGPCLRPASLDEIGQASTKMNVKVPSI